MGTENKPIDGFKAWKDDIDRRLAQQERRTTIQDGPQLLGPGFGATGTQIIDWNDEDVLFNGYYWSPVDSLNSPDSTKEWAGHVVSNDDTAHGVQTVWSVSDGDPPVKYLRRFENLGVTTPTFTTWQPEGGSSNVLTGIQDGADVISITSTTAGAGTSEADGDHSIAVGLDSFAGTDPTNGAAAIAVGPSTQANIGGGIAIGDSARSDGDNITDIGGIAIGFSAFAVRTAAIAIGQSAETEGVGAIAIGNNGSGDQAKAVGDGSVAIGGDAQALGDGTPPLPGNESSIAIGLDSSASAQGIAIGQGSVADVAGVTVGSGVTWDGHPGQTAIGADITISAQYSTGVGYGVLMGDYGTSSSGDYSTALGAKTQARKNGSVALGCDHTGAGAVSNVQDEIRLGTANHITVVEGKLVITDSSGGLHRIVVSTGGVLSTVAYP